MVENLKFKVTYYMGKKCVKVLEIIKNESTFKEFIADLLIDLPYQLYIDKNNYWSWVDLYDYKYGDLIFSLRSYKSNILIEVVKR